MPYKYQDQWHVKMREYLKYLQQRQRSPHTIKDYKNALHNTWILLGKPNSPHDVPLKDYQSLEILMESKGLKENTLSTYMRHLVIFLRFVKYSDVEEIYIHSKIIPKEDRIFLSEQEISIIREVAHGLGARYELTFSLGVDNGLRRGDIARITFEEAKSILTTRQAFLTCKGNKRRQVLIHKLTLEPLDAYVRERRQMLSEQGLQEEEKYLFINPYTKDSVIPGTIYTWIVELSDASAIYFRPHDLRATFVRRHSRAGTRPEIVMNLTGHSSWGTTFKYYYGQDVDEMRHAQDHI